MGTAFSKDDEIQPKPVEIEVEAFGGKTVWVRPTTLAEKEEYDELEQRVVNENDELRHGSLIRGVVSEHWVDESGERMWDLEDDEDIEKFELLPSDALTEIFLAVRHRQLRKAAKVEAAEGN